MTDCTFDSSGCLVCPYVPPTAGSAPSSSIGPNLGWNAGANWHESLDGDVHVVFTMPAVVGVVCGLRSDRDGVTEPGRITYGLQFQQVSGVPFFGVVELGSVVRSFDSYTSGDTFEIRRVGGIVMYFHTPAGATPVLAYTSRRRSAGPLLVTGCLYSAGDQIG